MSRSHRFGSAIENEIAISNGFECSFCTKGHIYLRDGLKMYWSGWAGWAVYNGSILIADDLKTIHEAIWHCDMIKHGLEVSNA